MKKSPRYIAQDILSRRDHSVAEVATKLKRKGFSAPEVEATIKWLKEQRLLDDQQFAERYVEQILRTKSVGPRWVRHHLQVKGIGAEGANAAVAAAYKGEREYEFLLAAADRWRQRHPNHAADIQRLSRFLLSRGFSSAGIARFLTARPG